MTIPEDMMAFIEETARKAAREGAKEVVAEQARKAVDLALADGKIKRANACRTGKPGCLIDDLRALKRVCGAFALDLGQIIEFLAEHLGHKLHTRQVGNLVFADKFAVAQNGNTVADGVDLLEKMRNKDNADAA